MGGFLPGISYASGELILSERHRPRNRYARDGILESPFADAMLNCRHLYGRPASAELGENATMTHVIAIKVVESFPGDDRGEMLGVPLGDPPLHHGIVRNAEHPHFAVAPWLHTCPFDPPDRVVGLERLERIEHALGPSCAPRIDADHGVAVGYPALRIGYFPA